MLANHHELRIFVGSERESIREVSATMISETQAPQVLPNKVVKGRAYLRPHGQPFGRNTKGQTQDVTAEEEDQTVDLGDAIDTDEELE